MSQVTRPKLEVKLFGGVHIAEGHRLIHENLMPKVKLLFCYLIINQRTHSRLSLATLFWGEMPEEKALANLRNALGSLKLHLPDSLHITRHAVRFIPTHTYELDVEQFHAALKSIPNDSELAIQIKLNRAIDLYTGEFLEGMAISNAPRFEEWMLLEREKLKTMVLYALRVMTQRCINARDILQGISLAMKQLEIEPSLEEAYQQLIILQTMSGQRTAALLQYERCERALLERLDVKPSEELRILHDQIAGTALSEV